MCRGFYTLFVGLFMGLVIIPQTWSQIQNVNISGTYSGTFMIGGSSAKYQVGGSPYLSETWMYGSLEMKGNIIEQTRKSKEVKKQLIQYNTLISRVDKLIEKLSDPEYHVSGMALSLEGQDEAGRDSSYNVWIENSDLEGIEKITEELGENLLFHLEQLKAAYEAKVNEFFKIDGLFRYNLYAQEFEMIYGRDTFSITAPFDLESITISNKKFIHGLYIKRISRRPYLGSSYFEVLSEGDFKLLMRHDVKIKSGGGPATYSWAGGGDAFVQDHHLYYQPSEGAEVVLLKKRKKNIRELFAGSTGEIDQFIRAERLHIKRIPDLIRVFDHYNQINRTTGP